MTSVLSRPPGGATVLREQLSASALSLRKEAIAFATVCGLFAAIVLRAALVTSATGQSRVLFGFDTAMGIPMVAFAALLPFSIWRSEDPARRAYHWVMPVSRVHHACLKVVAGLVWVLAGAGAYVGLVTVLSVIVTRATGIPAPGANAIWERLVPLSAAAVAYLAGSAVAVGVRRPWRWIMGVVPLACIVAMARVIGLAWLQDVANAAWYGRFGLSAALGINVLGATGLPDASRWLIATALWGGAAVAAMLVAASRYIEES